MDNNLGDLSRSTKNDSFKVKNVYFGFNDDDSLFKLELSWTELPRNTGSWIEIIKEKIKNRFRNVAQKNQSQSFL